MNHNRHQQQLTFGKEKPWGVKTSSGQWLYDQEGDEIITHPLVFSIWVCIRKGTELNLFNLHPFLSVNVNASAHMHECVGSCVWAHAFMCVIMFTHLSLLLIYRLLGSVPVRAPCQNKRLRPAKSDMWTVCLWGLQAMCVFLCTITLMLLDVYVCVCKARRSLSPGPNLGLYRGDIRFLSPPHICVSAAVTMIETVGTVCVCENGEAACVHVCVRVWWQVTQNPVSNRRRLDKVRPLKLSSLSAH